MIKIAFYLRSGRVVQWTHNAYADTPDGFADWLRATFTRPGITHIAGDRDMISVDAIEYLERITP